MYYSRMTETGTYRVFTKVELKIVKKCPKNIGVPLLTHGPLNGCDHLGIFKNNSFSD